MAMQETGEAPAPTHIASLVGNAFVGQYYNILHHSPELVHKFYQDDSSLTREDNSGIMETVTTMQAINEKIMSLNYGEFIGEIITVDAQASYEKGVVVLVTGCMTGKNNLRKNFTQTFFLAAQEKSLRYYVLNDIFRFVEETSEKSKPGINENANGDSPSAILAAEPESTHTAHQSDVDSANVYPVGNQDNGPEVVDPSDHEEGSVVEEIGEPPADFKEHQTLAPIDSAPISQAPISQDDAPKKSYVSILKVPKTSSGPVYVAVSSAPATIDPRSLDLAKPASIEDPLAPRADNSPESSNFSDEAEGYSIHIRNLPFEATVKQLEEVFKKFGPIKQNGIQVRSNKLQGFCFGFVEFEQSGSAHSAIESSPITIGNRRAVVEEKRTTTRVGNGGRGRYSSGRGGFRSDSFKFNGRENYSGGRGYGKNELRNNGDFHGRPKESNMRYRENNYRQVNQNGSGRGNRGGGVNHSTPTD